MSIITVHDGISTLAGTTGQITLSDTGRFALAGDHDITLSVPDPFTPVHIHPTGPAITAGSGTGVTVVKTGTVRQLCYKVTTDYTAYAAAAVTGDVTLCTLPAKTRVVGFYSDTTAAFTGGAVSATTLKVGLTAGAAEVLAVHDIFSAAITKGLADADMGTSMVRSALIQNAYFPSFTTTKTLVARITTTTANTNALTAGSTTFYVFTETLP